METLCIIFPEANAYRINLDEAECLSFLAKEKGIFRKI